MYLFFFAENEDFDAVTTEDEKEKTPELLISNQNQDSGIDAHSQASSSEPDSTISGKITTGHGSNNSSSHSNSMAKNNLSNSEDNSKNISSSLDSTTSSNNNLLTSNETRASKGKAKNKKNKKLQGIYEIDFGISLPRSSTSQNF